MEDKLLIENALRYERDQAREYLDIAGVILLALNTEGEITLINKRGAEIIGTETGDIVGMPWFETFIPESDREAVSAVYARIISGDLPPVEYFGNKIMTVNGEIRLVAWHNAILRDEAGCITGTLSSGEDITARRQAEETLKRQAYLLNSVSDAIISSNPDYIIESWNDAAERMYGWSAEEVIGKSYQDVLQPVYRDKTREVVLEAFWSTGSWHGEVLHRCKDGTTIPILAEVAQLVDENGNETGLVSANRDISERVRAEQALIRRLAMEELVTSISTRFVTITPDDFTERIDQTLKGLGEFFDVDRCHLLFTAPINDFIDHTYEWCAGAVTARADQVQGLSLEPFQWVMGKLHRMEIVHVPRMEGLPLEAHIEKTYWQANGVLSVLSIPIEHHESLAGILGFSMTRTEMTWSDEDLRLMKLVGEMITHVLNRFEARQTLTAYAGQLETMVQTRTQALQNAQEQLLRREKLAMMGQLAGGIGHEIRNPLGAIKNAAYLLEMLLAKQPASDWDEEHYALNILKTEVENADNIITSLLDYARTKKPITVEVKINQVLNDVLTRTPLPSHVETVCVLDSADPSISGDYGQVMQIFNNLVLNAVEAMPEAGCLTIRTSEVTDPETPPRQWVEVTISETGVGIAEKNINKIFEPLFTTKSKGIGLGLALVRILIDGHEGNLRVKSTEGKGSEFTVRLPAWSG